MTDQPIAFRVDGRPIYDNTPTVVCVIMLTYDNKLVAIRRNNEPGKGLIGLPGGYHMSGETWQQAGAREVKEETGYIINPANLVLTSLQTDEYGNNLVIALNTQNPTDVVATTDGEGEVLYLDPNNLPLRPDWAFFRHYRAVRDFFFFGV